MKNFFCSICSAVAGASSVSAAVAGDDFMAWVMLAINAALLVANAVVEIYRKWRDRDDDKKGGKKK